MIRCEDLKRSICFSAANIIIRNSNLLILFPVFFLWWELWKDVLSQQLSNITTKYCNYTLCTLHYALRTYLSCNWKFVPFGPFYSFCPPLAHPLPTPPPFRQPPLGCFCDFDFIRFRIPVRSVFVFLCLISVSAVPSGFHPYCPQVRFMLSKNLDMHFKCTNLLL